MLIAVAAQVLFPLALILVAPHLGLGGCPETDAIRARAGQYSWAVIGIEIGLFIAVTASLVWWSAGRRRRWAWLSAGLSLQVLLAAASLLIGGLSALNLCNMLSV